MVRLRRQVTHVPSTIVSGSLEAFLLMLKGEITDLQAMASDMVALCRRLELPQWEGCFTVLEGWARIRQGGEAEVCDLMRAGLERVLAAGTRWRMTSYRTLVADAMRRCGRLGEAQLQIEQALRDMHDQREHTTEVQALEVRGSLASDLGQTDEAWNTLRAAVDLADRQSAPGLGLGAAMALARHARAQGRGTEAVAVLAAQLAAFSEADCPALREGRALLQALEG
jgi:hypothetical protein